jgi:AcrR family transcriptional regulator
MSDKLSALLPTPRNMNNKAQPAATSTYHHGDLRNALIAQGRLQLEQLGPQELSLRSLARAVGVSEAAPSRHFAGKAGLLAAIAADGFHELAQIRHRISGSKQGALVIAYQMMSSYVSFAREHRGLFNLMTGPRILARDEYPELAAQSARSFGAFAGAIANYAQSCGWDDEALQLVGHGAWAMEHGIATLILSERLPRPDLPVDVDAMIEFSIHMYLCAIKAGPTAFKKLSDKTAKDVAAART